MFSYPPSRNCIPFCFREPILIVRFGFTLIFSIPQWNSCMLWNLRFMWCSDVKFWSKHNGATGFPKNELPRPPVTEVSLSYFRSGEIEDCGNEGRINPNFIVLRHPWLPSKSMRVDGFADFDSIVSWQDHEVHQNQSSLYPFWRGQGESSLHLKEIYLYWDFAESVPVIQSA